MLHYSRRTEKAYVGWVRRFFDWLASTERRAPVDSGEGDVKEFLTPPVYVLRLPLGI